MAISTSASAESRHHRHTALTDAQPWITPSLFEDKPEWVVDEWSYGQYITSHGGNMTEIRNHWDNWFSYSQFER